MLKDPHTCHSQCEEAVHSLAWQHAEDSFDIHVALFLCVTSLFVEKKANERRDTKQKKRKLIHCGVRSVVRRYTSQILTGLDYLHRLCIVHRCVRCMQRTVVATGEKGGEYLLRIRGRTCQALSKSLQSYDAFTLFGSSRRHAFKAG